MVKSKPGSTNPLEVARAAGVGERESSRAKAGDLFERFAAWRRDRRERRWEASASADGRAAQLRFDEHRTVGSSTIGNDAGIDSVGPW